MPRTGTIPAERTVVRYANRKLYDRHDRRYITLDALSELAARGADLTIRELSASGRDISSQVLGAALVETLKRRTNTLPKRILQRIIAIALASAGRREALPAVPDAAARIGREAERIAGDLITRGRLGLEDAAALRTAIVAAAGRAVHDAQHSVERRLGELVASSEKEFGVMPSLTTLKERLATLETSLPGAARPRAGRKQVARRKLSHSKTK
jgi:hypothetical protein